MKIKTITSTLMLAFFPGLALADLVDFGTATKANEAGGFVVTGVFQATPAAKIGIAEGDVVTKLDGRKLNATAPLARLIAGVCEADSEVQVDWLRGDVEMSGKATLDKTLSDEAFDERYPDKAAAKKLSPEEEMEMLFSDDIDDVEIDPLKDLKQMGVDVDGLQKQIEEAMKESALNGLFSSPASASFTMSTTVSSSGGNTITVKKSGGEKHQVTIKSKDGETIFDEKITKDELDRVPEEHRERVEGMLDGGVSVRIQDFNDLRNRTGTPGSGSIGGIGEPSDVEESAADLLKKLEQEKEEDGGEEEK